MLVKDSEDRFQAILQSVADGIVTTDEQGFIESFNPAAERMFRYSATEAIGVNIRDLMPDHDGSAAVIQVSDSPVSMHPGIVGSRRVFDGRRKDGSTFSIDLAVTELEIAGRRHLTSIVRDISERLAAQEEMQWLAAVVESVDNAIISCDTQGIINSWNRAAESLYGYTAQEAIGNSLELITPREFASTLGERINAAIAGTTSGYFETQRLTKDERRLDVSITASRVFDTRCNVVGLAAVHRDVSGQKLAEQANRDLVVVNERSRFAREIHDTLAQSFTLMVLRLDLVGDAMKSDLGAARAELDAIKLLVTSCAEEVRRSIWDLLPQALDSSGLVEAVQIEVDRLRRYKIEGRFRVSGAEEITMDRRHQSAALRVVQEALSNVINHSMANAAMVALKFERESLGITVVDNGIGFEPQAARVISPTEGGFGLSSIQERVRLTGGSMQVHSNPGQGTSIVIHIPYHSAEHGTTGSN